MPELSSSEPTIEQQMQQKCLEWQKLLRLADWDISVKVVPAMDMFSQGAWGTCRWELNGRTADIKLVTIEDSEKQRGMRPYSMEETLIHELLHLHIAPFQPEDESQDTAVEFAINAISGALFKLAGHEAQPE
jgi:hypothetical protein